jgi:hypothetical protein
MNLVTDFVRYHPDDRFTQLITVAVGTKAARAILVIETPQQIYELLEYEQQRSANLSKRVDSR